jgi:hypothetical protein
LGAPLGELGVGAVVGEAPEDDEPRCRLDQAVGTEADERDRARGDAGSDGNGELDRVPAVAAPSERSSDFSASNSVLIVATVAPSSGWPPSSPHRPSELAETIRRERRSPSSAPTSTCRRSIASARSAAPA